MIFIGAIVLLGSFRLTYGDGVGLLNYGALLAFMGVNASSFVHYYLKKGERTVLNFIVPMVGFFVCLGLWWHLSARALRWGSIWMLAGIAFGAWKTRGFREQLSFEAPAE